MKKTIAATLTALTALSVTMAPATAGTLITDKTWGKGSVAIEKLATGVKCDAIAKKKALISPDTTLTYDENYAKFIKDKNVRDVLSEKLTEKAKGNAKYITPEVRESLIDLGVATGLKRAAECKIIPGDDAVKKASEKVQAVKAQGDKKFKDTTPNDMFGLFMGLTASLSSSISS